MISAGTFVAPRAGETTLRDFHEQWLTTRVVAPATAQKDASHWKNHVEPEFGGWPMGSITRPHLRRWVKAMIDQRVGVWTIQAAVSALSAIMHAAVEDGLIPANPVSGLRLPRVDAKPVFYWTKEQAARIIAAVPEDYRLMVDIDMHVGLRWAELAGLKRRYVDLDSGVIQVVGVQTRSGWREYPKSRMSRRVVPIPPARRADLAAACDGLEPNDLVFRAPRGGPWDDRNFSRRVFSPAVLAAKAPTGSVHDMRHTAASWLVQAGVTLYKVQALLGHESFKTTQRYAHLAPDEFDDITAAWS
jgi:integrase